ncbi:MAG: amidohydrolase [Candidatus Rokubacteria bacterium]|nr:amidohydrolase [Candidatus Rokubacteria bacterium]
MIIDAHAHSFPDVSEPCGFDNVESHMRSIQIHFTGYPQRARRAADNAQVAEDTLYDGKNEGISGLFDVNWRVGKYGRFEWTRGGVDYRMTWMPPLMREKTEFPLDVLIAYMDLADVDKAVLHNAYVYGMLNDYLGECVRQYPDRLRAVAQITESRADQESEILELRRAVKELGLVGLYFQTEALFLNDYEFHLASERLNPLWEEVRALRIPVLWNLRPDSQPRRESYVNQFRRVGIWARRYPDIQSVVTHGFNVRYIIDSGGRATVPDEMVEVLKLPNVTFELLFHIMQGGVWDYPYPEAQEVIKFLYRRLGASKLVWGSDIPSSLPRCTYQQSLNYVRQHCTFISPSDMDLILGGNAAALFRFQ